MHADVACMYAKKGCQTNLSLYLPHFLKHTQIHRHTHTHSKRFKQTHLCFIALMCLVCFWLRSQTDPMSPSAAIQYTHTHTSQWKQHAHTVDACAGGHTVNIGTTPIRTIWIKLMKYTHTLIYTIETVDTLFLSHLVRTHLPILSSSIIHFSATPVLVIIKCQIRIWMSLCATFIKGLFFNTFSHLSTCFLVCLTDTESWPTS